MIATNSHIPVDTQTTSSPCLACPVCGDAYVHPVGIECRSPGTATGVVVIDEQGVAIDPGVPPIGRGVAIKLKFICESGHGFDYELRFHKGNTFLSRSMTDLHGGPTEWPQTIWRD